MPNYRRSRVAGGTYFFTVVLEDRGSTLLVDCIDALREAVRYARTRRPFAIDAWVILPDHMHTVWTLPADDADYPSRWQAIKAAFSRSIEGRFESRQARQARGERGIWQRRFWEHTIRDDDDFASHVAYVHFNPVKHGLVSQVGDWPHSTFHRYVAERRLPPDWAGNPSGNIEVGERRVD